MKLPTTKSFCLEVTLLIGYLGMHACYLIAKIPTTKAQLTALQNASSKFFHHSRELNQLPPAVDLTTLDPWRGEMLMVTEPGIWRFTFGGVVQFTSLSWGAVKLQLNSTVKARSADNLFSVRSRCRSLCTYRLTNQMHALNTLLRPFSSRAGRARCLF